ncbi:cytochrome c oxidase subunit V [Cavenderia fasciculata]|uniref:Cytochrome c oxidase subunit V n=1 Tax=Cavenderia fasciculata TaxID=261658 RepID=F4Q504_CACFS|nr:cytochrome c oxidase subunit V [Cavenderia fasciculata]EGG17110.1 cytochrome c oxidase subunit V [Cavenderia fasciculata]|eukprot:XP_004355594.1 cytochrome c oxidase subunit V [Cavenderia fasciculata]
MTVLSRDEVLKCIESGEISISPFDPDALGGATLDLTLSNEFRVFSKESETILVTDETNYRDYTKHFVLGEGETFILEPRSLVLAITKETVFALSQLLWSTRRMGLFVHLSTGFMQPSTSSPTVLEIFNASNNRLELKPGSKMCQLIFMKMEGQASYTGRFRDNHLHKKSNRALKDVKEIFTPGHSMEFFHKPGNSLIERAELNASRKALQDKRSNEFGHEVLSGFGTIKSPVIVESIFDNRIVGCEGGDGEEHDLVFHKLTAKKPIICVDCGQAFKLKKISTENEVMYY